MKHPRLRIVARSILFISCLLCYATSFRLIAAETETDRETKRDTLIAGVRQRLADLKSGAVKIEGIKRSYRNKEAESKPGEFQIDYLFSGAKLRSLRSENGEIFPDIVLGPDADEEQLKQNGVNVDDFKVRTGKVETRTYREEKEKGQWRTGQRHACINPIPSARDDGRMFDIRAVGLQGWVEFQREEFADTAIAGWEKHQDFDIKDEGNGVWLYERFFRDRSSIIKWSIQIDESKGFITKSVKCQTKGRLSSSWIVHQELETDWAQISGVWVPEASRMQSRGRDWLQANKLQEAIDLKFVWLQVNERVSNDEFSIESLNLPESAGIIDFTEGGKGVVLREAKKIVLSPLKK